MKKIVSSPKFIPLPHQPLLTRPLVVLFLIALLATLIYSNSFSAPFFLDDTQNIIENPLIKHLSNFLDLSGSRYVGLLSFALNYHLGGLNVFGYHLVNLLIHIINGFLVYSLVLLLFKATYNSQHASAPWIALATALLFIAHPIQTQAVTYIVQRFASLATLFYLLSVVCYLKWRLQIPPPLRGGGEGEGGHRKWGWYVASLLSCILGMKTKEFVFTLPLMILLMEILFFWPLTKRDWIYLIPFLLTLLVIPFSRLDTAGEKELFSSGIPEISQSAYFFTQFRVIVTYLRLLVLPVHQNLDYDYPIYHSLFTPSVLGSFLFLLGLLVMAVRHIRHIGQVRLISFGILWFFLTLSAESSIIPIDDLIFEHRVYLPSVGIFLSFCAAWGLGVGRIKSERGRGIIGLLSIGMIILTFSFATCQRNRVWQDELTLWHDVVRKAPHKARGYNNLGNAYSKQGRLEEAIREYQTAVRLNPDYADAHSNLGVAYKKQGHMEEAIRECQTVLRLQPDNADAHNNLGVAYKNQGYLEEAIREYQAAIRLQPDHVEAHNNLGVAYKKQGRLEEAIREYQAAIRLQLDYVAAHYNLANAYKKLGRWEEAKASLNLALQIRPDFPEARQALDALSVTNQNE